MKLLNLKHKDITTNDVQVAKMHMDYTLMELHEAILANDDVKVLELKDKMESIRLLLLELNYF